MTSEESRNGRKFIKDFFFIGAIIGFVFLGRLNIPRITGQSGKKVPRIMINEIAWMGTTVSANDEWIELFNNSNEDVSLDNWHIRKIDNSNQTDLIELSGDIPGNSFYLLERTDDNSVPNIEADIIYTGSLSDDGQILELYDDLDNLVDTTFVDGVLEGWVAGNKDSKKTMERGAPDDWCDSLEPDGTPKSENSCVNVPYAEFSLNDVEFNIDEKIIFDASMSMSNITEDEYLKYQWIFGDGTMESYIDEPLIEHSYIEVGEYTVSLTVTNSMGKESPIHSITIEILENPDVTEGIVINEFVSDPMSGENEWIELFNYTSKDILIENWELHDGAKNSLITTVEGNIGAQGFFVYELETAKLNNSGDKIVLKNSNEVIVDQVSYGNFDDGNIYDNTVSANDPNSVARYEDGLDTNIDLDDFKATTAVTKGTPNIITAEKENIVGSDNYQFSNLILISEILPNPEGSDDYEWIELYNSSDQDVNLNGWQLDDVLNSGSSPFVFDDSYVIKAKSYLVITKEESKLALNNSDEEINLIDPNGTVISSISYDTSFEGQSYAIRTDGIFQWTAQPTKGSSNIFVTSGIQVDNGAEGFLHSDKANTSQIGDHSNKNFSEISYEKVSIPKKNLSLPKEIDLNYLGKQKDIFFWILLISEIIMFLYIFWKLSKYILSKLNKF